MANSQIGNNEYTDVNKRRLQHLTVHSKPEQVTVPDSTAAAPAVVASPAIDSGYNEYKALLAELRAERDAQVQAAYNQGKQSLDAARANSNKDAYIAYMHGLKNMPQISAVSGNGGYAQSLATKQQLNYENNRADIMQNYMDNLRQLQANRDAGVLSNGQDYLAQMAELVKDNTTTAAKAASSAAAGTTSGEYNYKLNGKNYNAQEFVNYLKGIGMTQADIARYMQANGLSL